MESQGAATQEIARNVEPGGRSASARSTIVTSPGDAGRADGRFPLRLLGADVRAEPIRAAALRGQAHVPEPVADAFETGAPG